MPGNRDMSYWGFVFEGTKVFECEVTRLVISVHGFLYWFLLCV